MPEVVDSIALRNTVEEVISRRAADELRRGG
jgi:hypothetical protein